MFNFIVEFDNGVRRSFPNVSIHTDGKTILNSSGLAIYLQPQRVLWSTMEPVEQEEQLEEESDEAS